MTITEASQLVIQAGALSKGSDVFILDMGKPIKIKDLIKRMVSLSGLTIKEKNKTDGDIEIKITGLRPGEKLYEELLLGEKPQLTDHPKINRAQDTFIPYEKLKPHLIDLKKKVDEGKTLEILILLEKIVYGYKWNGKLVDKLSKK